MKRKAKPERLPFQLLVGDTVAYFATIGEPGPTMVARVREVWPRGIPSCQKRMLLLEGKAGCVLESHCRLVPTEEAS